jgi:hypothetical protein
LFTGHSSLSWRRCFGEDLVSDPRPPASDRELQQWLKNMVWYHHLTFDEMTGATGLTGDQLQSALSRLQISAADRPARPVGSPLLVLPYPGGRHPRIGFLDGAIRPQRETKLSVFTPWDADSYVVLDIPEAIWSNLGLTYLAHTHIPTIWDKQNVSLPKQEWRVAKDAAYVSERTLPNGIAFGTRVRSMPDHLEMDMWLTNGTDSTLTDLRVQNCVLLKAADGFAQQTNDNKYFSGPYVACHSADKRRWVITAWEPLHRSWANAPCPCLHSDPKFPDCAAGDTKRLRGWLSFYEGTDIDAEIARINATRWQQNP